MEEFNNQNEIENEIENISSPILIEMDEELISEFRELIKLKTPALVVNLLIDLYPADIAHLINHLHLNEAKYIFQLLEKDIASEVITNINESHRANLFSVLNKSQLSSIITQLPSDDATDLVAEMPDEIAKEIIEQLDFPTQSDLKELLQYAPNTAGGIMEKEYIAVNLNDTIHKAIQTVRKHSEYVDDVYNIFVVNDEGKIVGDLPIKNLLIHSSNKKMKSVMNQDVITADVFLDQEEVARLFKKYSLVVVPVVKEDGILVGSISFDDLVYVIEEETSEDVYKMAGSNVAEIETKSPFAVAKMRIPWLLISMGFSLCSGFVISAFSETLSKLILLASFMPVISAISGNVGLQSAVIVVRGLSTGHVNSSEWKKEWWKEIRVVFLIALVCGIVIAIIGIIWSRNNLFGVVVGSSMFLSMSIAVTMGTLSPILSQKFGIDPAVSAGPFTTTLQDIIGITTFLSISSLLLNQLGV